VIFNQILFNTDHHHCILIQHNGRTSLLSP